MSGPRRRASGRITPLAATFFLLVLATVGSVRAGWAQDPFSSSGPRLRWWHGLVAVGGYAVLTVFDDDLRRLAQDSRSGTSNDVASMTRKMGQPEVYGTIALGLLATGFLTHDQKIRDAGIRVTRGLAMTGVITEAFKLAAGRRRPSSGGSDADDYRPFSGQTSTPSGHASMAFSLATSLSDEIHRPWATAVLFTLASGTAWSRVNDNVHWVSDVVAGAALGIVTAKFANGKLRLFGIRAPTIAARADRLTVSWQGQL